MILWWSMVNARKNKDSFGLCLTVRKNSIMLLNAYRGNLMLKWTRGGGIWTKMWNLGGGNCIISMGRSGNKLLLLMNSQRIWRRSMMHFLVEINSNDSYNFNIYIYIGKYLNHVLILTIAIYYIIWKYKKMNRLNTT